MLKKIDNLGRVVIPQPMRKQLEINEGDLVNIELVDNKIIITNPKEVDYKARIDKAIEYIEYVGMDQTFDKVLIEILKGE